MVKRKAKGKKPAASSCRPKHRRPVADVQGRLTPEMISVIAGCAGTSDIDIITNDILSSTKVRRSKK